MSRSASSWSLTSETSLIPREKEEKPGSSPSLPTDATTTMSMNTRDKKGNTPLRDAVRKNDIREARRLLTAGCDPNICDNFGVTPLHEATERDNIEMLELLISKGNC